MDPPNVFQSSFGKKCPVYAEIVMKDLFRHCKDGLTDEKFLRYHLSSKEEHMTRLCFRPFAVQHPQSVQSEPQVKRMRVDQGLRIDSTMNEEEPILSSMMEQQHLHRLTVADIFQSPSNVVLFLKKDSALYSSFSKSFPSWSCQVASFVLQDDGTVHAEFVAAVLTSVKPIGVSLSELCDDRSITGGLESNRGAVLQLLVKQKGGQDATAAITVPLWDFIRGDEVQIWAPLTGLNTTRFKAYITGLGTRHDDSSRNLALANLLRETRGDSLQVLSLTNSILINSMLKRKNRAVNDLRRTTKAAKDMKASASQERKQRETDFLDLVEKTFRDAMIGSLGKFVNIREPLVSSRDIDRLVEVFKTTLPFTYQSFRKLYGSKWKAPSRRTEYKLLWKYLESCRAVNPRLLKCFASVFALAFEGSRGRGSQVTRHYATATGLAMKRQKALEFLKILHNEYGSNPSEQVSQDSHKMCVYDNSQKISKLKYSKGGKSSASLLTTCRFIREVVPPDFDELSDRAGLWFEYNEGIGPDDVTIVDQKIPAPLGMMPFEWFDYDDNAVVARVFENVDLGGGMINPCMFYEGESAAAFSMQSFHAPDMKNLKTTDGLRSRAYVQLKKLADACKSMKRHISGPTAVSQREASGLIVTPEMRQVFQTAHENRELLTQASRFQEETVKSWNSNVLVVTKLLPLPMSKYPEDTVLGCGAVYIELLRDVGVLDHNAEDRKQAFKIKEDQQSSKVFIAGDAMTINRLVSFQRKIESATKSGHVEQQAAIRALNQAVEMAVHIPGDWHFSLHMLSAILNLAYGQYLQAAQEAIQFNGLKKDPSEKYQKTVDFLTLFHGASERLLWDLFVQTPEAHEAARETTNPAIALAKGFLAFVDRLEKCEIDEVVRFATRVYMLIDDFLQLIASIGVGDSVYVEYLYLDWLPVFVVAEKPQYKEVCARKIEDLYLSDPVSLAVERTNHFVRLSKGKHMIALDAMCEQLNAYYADLAECKSLDSFIELSRWLPQLRKALATYKTIFMAPRSSHKHDDAYEERAGRESFNPINDEVPPPKSSVKPRRLAESKRLYELLQMGRVFEPKDGRLMKHLDLFVLIKDLPTPLVNKENNIENGGKETAAVPLVAAAVSQSVAGAVVPTTSSQSTIAIEGLGLEEMEGQLLCENEDDVAAVHGGAEEQGSSDEEEESDEEQDDDGKMVDLLDDLASFLAKDPTSGSDEANLDGRQEQDQVVTDAADQADKNAQDGNTVKVGTTVLKKYRLDPRLASKKPIREVGLAKLRKENFIQKRETRKNETRKAQALNAMLHEYVMATKEQEERAELSFERTGPLHSSQQLYRELVQRANQQQQSEGQK